jgi:hypothetical protein
LFGVRLVVDTEEEEWVYRSVDLKEQNKTELKYEAVDDDA